MADQELIEQLRRPEVYPHAVEKVELLSTHISWLLFAGEFVYKLKQPVKLEFLDYRSLESRRHFCEEEVRLNRRLARETYLGVVPIARVRDGSLRVEGSGETVEWAVKMVRLPAERMLDALLDSGRFGREQLDPLARLLERFHERAETGEGVDEHGLPDAVASKVLDNLAQTSSFLRGDGRRPAVLSEPLHGFLERRAREFLDGHRELMLRRVRDGRIREGHGDLHAGNICLTESGIVVYDCIEFSRALRCGDVASDLAFLAMDLDYRGYFRMSDELVARYAALARDDELVGLTRFYKSYRAVVRAKVAALTADSEEADSELAASKHREARRYFQLAASYELPPCLTITCGLPGSGKSWLARRVGRLLRARVVRSDVVRKRLAGTRPEEKRGSEYGEGIYTRRMTSLTYDRMAEEARSVLQAGRSVIVDASFSRRDLREPYARLSEKLGIPLIVLFVRAPLETVRERLSRRADDPTEASDADLEIYRRAKNGFEPPDEIPDASVVETHSGKESVEGVTARLLERVVGMLSRGG
jgi:aminoglycoside phosphotransferase family enzyme/shikimate kinase